MNYPIFLKLNFKQIFLVVFVLFSQLPAIQAQEDISSDELFIKARNTAFEKKNYPKAIAITKQALEKSPDYADIRIFLGRLYTWTDKVDSARVEFERVLEKNPGHEDGSLAYGSLEFWNDNSKKAKAIVNSGLEFHPKSEELLYLKARILTDLTRIS